MQETEVVFTHYTDFYINESRNKRLRHQGARERQRVTSLREFKSVISHYQCTDVSQVIDQGRYLPMFQSPATGKAVVRLHSITLHLINGEVPTELQLAPLLERLGLQMAEAELALMGLCYHSGHAIADTIAVPIHSYGKECLV